MSRILALVLIDALRMDATFWAARWREGKIGFHEGAPNAYLTRFAHRLDGKARVLVPLCGKSVDLAFLAGRGHEVIGVELIEDAVRAFFDEHGLVPEVEPRGELVAYRAGPITILAGDLFAVRRPDVGRIDAIYDRAALVALPEALRQRYVDQLLHLSSPWLHALTLTLEYEQARMQGPPFAVLETELMRLYDGYSIELLAEAPDTRVRENAPPMLERCFLVTG